MKQSGLFFLFFLVSISVISQRVPSGDLISRGIELFGEGRYDEAVEVYKMVHENDSNYTLMLAELALAKIQLEQYDRAIYYTKKGLSQPTSYRQHLMRTMGTAYDLSGFTDETINIYQEAIDLYPYSYLLHYNLGVTFMKVERYHEAVKSFQEALRCNPYHASSHMLLGILMARQELFTKALLSLQTFLAIEPHSGRSNQILVYVENICSNYLDPTHGEFINPFTDNTLFNEIDHLIKSKVVLNPRYQSPIPFDASLVKQTSMIFETLQFDVVSDDFWVEMYFPFYKAIRDENLLVPFLYTILRSTGRETVQEYIENRRNQAELNRFYAAGPFLSQIREYRTIEINGEELKLACNYYDNGSLNTLGNTDASGKAYGLWQFFYPNGELMSVGYMINDVKDGKWKYYDNRGLLEMVENYDNGILNGEFRNYHETERISLLANYVNDKIEGEAFLFNIFGDTIQIFTLKETQLHGKAKSFYSSSQLREDYYYDNNEIDGEFLLYHYNGELANKTNFKNGVKDGAYLEYFSNKMLSMKGYYVDGKEIGEWRSYHPNGCLKMARNFSDGLPIGIEKEFFYNGILNTERNYNNKGQMHGTTIIYDHRGNKIVEEEYQNDLIVKVTSNFNSPEGPAVYGSPDGTFSFIVYDFDGKIKSQGQFIDGALNGEWASYYKNGNLFQTVEYNHGSPDGKMINFHPNGRVKHEFLFDDGVAEGKFTGYFLDGKLENTGYYTNGSEDYYWTYYLPNGNITTLSYFENGMVTGWFTNYAVDGKVKRRFKYKDGLFVGQKLFDPDGEVVIDSDFLENKLFQIKHSRDHLLAESSIKGGEYEGTFKWFHPGGSIMSQREVMNGKDAGQYEHFDEQGNLLAKGCFLDGERHGKWTFYYEDGQKRSVGNYFAGMKDSLHISYFENGNVRLIENFFNDQLDGDLLLFGLDGELMIKIIYYMDEIIGYQYSINGELLELVPVKTHDQTILAYYDNGNKSFEQHFKDFVAHGPLIKYYSDGTMMEYREYENGLLNGKNEFYYPDGKLKRKYFSTDNLFEGEFVDYWENGNVKKIINYKHDEEHGEKIFFDENGLLQKTELYWSGSFIGFN